LADKNSEPYRFVSRDAAPAHPAPGAHRRRWQRGRAFIANYALIVRIYAVSFAVVHLSNFAFDTGIGWRAGFVVLAVMSQLMSGLVLSYLRLRQVGWPSARRDARWRSHSSD
jgi:hypothetical protein